MAVVRIHRAKVEGPDRYEALMKETGSNENVPEGLIFHGFGQVADGEWQSIDVWQSDEDADRFEREHFEAARGRLEDTVERSTTTYQLHNIVQP